MPKLPPGFSLVEEQAQPQLPPGFSPVDAPKPPPGFTLVGETAPEAGTPAPAEAPRAPADAAHTEPGYVASLDNAISGGRGPMAPAIRTAWQVFKELSGRNLTVKAAEGVAGQQLAPTPSDLGTVGNLAAGMAANVYDPVAHGVGWLAGGALKNFPGISRLWSAAPELAARKAAADAGVAVAKDAADASLKSGLADWLGAKLAYNANLVARNSLEGAAAAGSYMGADEALNQLQARKFDGAAIAAKTLSGLGMGAIAGPVFGLGMRKVFGNPELADAAAKLRVVPEATAVAHETFDTVKQIDEQLATAKTDLAKLQETHAEQLKKLDPANADQALQVSQVMTSAEDHVKQLEQLREAHINDLKEATTLPEATHEGVEIDPRYLNSRYHDQLIDTLDPVVQRLVDRNVISAEHKPAYMANTFLRALDALPPPAKQYAGVWQDVAHSWLNKFLNPTELHSLYDRELGTNLTGATLKMQMAATKRTHLEASLQDASLPLVASLEKKGFDRNQLWQLLEHIETGPDGVAVFDPSGRGGTAARAPYVGARPSATLLIEHPELAALRQHLDQLQSTVDQAGTDIGYIPGYVPRIPKAGSSSTQGGASLASTLTPGFTKARTPDMLFDPASHETDMMKILSTYNRAAAKHLAYNEAMPDLFREFSKLAIMQEKNPRAGAALKNFGNYAGDMLGYKDKMSAQVAGDFAKSILSSNKDIIGSITKSPELQATIWDDVLKTMNSMLYNNMALKSPRVFFLHAMKPAFVGAVEVGPQYMAKAYWMNDAEKKLAGSLENILHLANPSELGNIESGIQNKGLKAINWASTLEGRYLGKPLMTAIERNDRSRTFIAGYRQMQDAMKTGSIEGTLDGLLTGEKQAVVQALERGGQESAAQLYGVIRSYRTNLVYGKSNTPEILRGKLGEIVPFTTWSRNQMARFAQDAVGGSYSKLVQRIAYPLVVNASFRAASGYDISNSEPVHEAIGALTPKINPMFGQVADVVAGPDRLQKLAKYAEPHIPVLSDIVKFNRQYKKNYDVGEGLSGFTKVQGSPVQRALNPLVEKRRAGQ